ncbi:AT-rich interactive domain-containing protein 3B-like [Pungitius pungitius]|uniref:AT-rich interactive domain-containing protein 3B-like n=1 Tax=Pungitius pungitius TaxID=134920 RepID=UPI002E1434F2
MMDYSKAQMLSLSEAATSVGCPQSSNAGVKLEAVMEQLQRQHGAKLEMNLQEKHLLHAQLLFAQHAAAARPSDSRVERTYQAAHQALNGRVGRMDPDEEEDEDSDEEEQEMVEPEEYEEGVGDVRDGPRQQVKKPGFQQVVGFPLTPHSTAHSSAVKQMSDSPPSAIKQEQEEKALLSPAGKPNFTSPNGSADWGYDEPLNKRGNGMWAEENEGGKIRGEPSRDFAKLYELDHDPQRKEFLDDLFVFMQKRGTPVNRIPIMAKQVLDLYMLYKLVTEKGGLVEVINKKIWREITRGLNLPTSITSAAFTLRTQYMKYLYPFECEKKGLSSPGELQAAIDSNRREGRRPSYTNTLYRYSPSPSSASLGLLSSPTVQTPPTGHTGLSTSAPSHLSKRNADEMSTPVLPGRPPGALTLGQQQQQLAQAVTLEQFRERLERGAPGAAAPGGAAASGPEKKMMRMAEEQQRLMQQALQQNLLALASQFNPVNLKLNNRHESKQDLSQSVSTSGAASISVSVEVNGTVYSGMLFAQRSAAPMGSQNVTMAGTNGFSAMSSSHSPSSSSSSSSKGPH